MKKYLLLFRGGDARRIEQQKSPEEWQAHMSKWMQWMAALTEQKKFVGAEPLSNKEGKVLTGTKKILTDGPYMEGKEIVGGYLICLANNYDEAVEIAKGCPIFEHDGIVEVREIEELNADHSRK
ncbi:MAG: YciI family protein [Chitinophagales bacterium]